MLNGNNMRKSAYLDTESLFGQPLSKAARGDLWPELSLSIGSIIYRRSDVGTSIEQEFKGKLGFISYLEIQTNRPIKLSAQTSMGDVHGIYLLQSAGRMLLMREETKVFALDARRGIYAYLPSDNYKVTLPQGRWRIFSFYFLARLFDEHATKDFIFLKPLLDLKKNNASTAAVSQHFYVGEMTEMLIHRLCRGLNKKPLDRQVDIIRQLARLLKLSRRKLKGDFVPGSAAHYCMLANERVREGVKQRGAGFDLAEVYDQAPYSSKHLDRIFRSVYKRTIRDYKNERVIHMAKKLLLRGLPIKEVSIRCGFGEIRSFQRTFKQFTGMPPRSFQRKRSKA